MRDDCGREGGVGYADQPVSRGHAEGERQRRNDKRAIVYLAWGRVDVVKWKMPSM
jgi:hypothetical protein